MCRQDLRSLQKRIKELSFAVGEWQNPRQIFLYLLHEAFGPFVSISEHCCGLAAKDRNEVLFNLFRIKGHVLNGHLSPILGIHPSVYQESP